MSICKVWIVYLTLTFCERQTQWHSLMSVFPCVDGWGEEMWEIQYFLHSNLIWAWYWMAWTHSPHRAALGNPWFGFSFWGSGSSHLSFQHTYKHTLIHPQRQKTHGGNPCDAPTMGERPKEKTTWKHTDIKKKLHGSLSNHSHFSGGRYC